MKKGLQSILMAMFLVFNASLAFAQGIEVSGTVVDDGGQPLLGASVVGQGTTKGTRTNAKGEFTLSINNKIENIIISYTGMSTKTVPVAGGDLGTITLNNKSRALNDVVIVGYGSQKKNDLTSAINTVKAKDFQQGIVTTADQLILGKIPGIQITQNSGEPGAGARIRIRGGSSLNASNDPLIVVDGMILDANEKVLGSANPLNLINPNDIESMDILKDAAATAIYGNRGSNGVIIITTKKGSRKSETVNFTYTTNVSLNTLTNRKVDNLNAREFRDLVNLTQDSTIIKNLGKDSTDWMNAVTRNSFTTDNNISMTGGIIGLPYRLTVGNMYQQGVINTSFLNRYTAGLNLSPNFFHNSLKTTINTKYARTNDRYIDVGEVIGSALGFDPTQPIRVGSPDGNFGGYYEWLDNLGNPNENASKNPVGRYAQRNHTRIVDRFLGNVQLDYRLPFFKDIRLNVNAGLDNISSQSDLLLDKNSAGAWTLVNKGYYKPENEYRRSTLIEGFVNYNKTFNKHSIDAFVGGSEQNNYQYTANTAVYGGDSIKSPAKANPFKTWNTQIGFFGRFNYNYNNRYYLSGSLRRDYSSRFDPKVRVGNFPSLSAAWRINNEDFMKSNTTISNLKLRAGWGKTGQQNLNLGDYYYQGNYNISNGSAQYQFGNAYYPMYRADPNNPYLKWEVLRSINLGLDFGFFKNRISGSIDVYDRKTTDLMSKVTVPAGTATSNELLRNVGTMSNKGVELNFNFVPVASKSITWEINMNYTYNVNKIVSLTGNANQDTALFIPTGEISGFGQKIQLNKPGFSANTFYTYQQVYDKAGHPIEGVYVDQNKDGIVNESDLVANHSSEPRNLFGISSNVSFNRVNISFIARAQDGYVYNNISSEYGALAKLYNNGSFSNLHGSYYDTKFKAAQFRSDYYVENATFFKLDNISVGYNFGSISKTNTRASLRFNASVQNVFVITKYSGVDPELPSGIDRNVYPRPRVYSLGLQLDF
jgi:TonB-dependent starch-binding outer membrane protein SusC